MEVDKGEKIIVVVDSDIQVVYPQSEEGQIHFLECYKLNDYKMMLYPYFNIVFDEEAEKKLEGTKRFNPEEDEVGIKLLGLP